MNSEALAAPASPAKEALSPGEKPAQVWFHASRTGGMDQLHALSHLGTRKAAMDRAQSSKFGVQSMFMYTVTAKVESAVSVPDFGVNDQRGATHSWMRLADQLHYDKKLISSDERNTVFAAGEPFDIDGSGQFVFDDRLASDELARILASKKIDALLYVNEHEHKGRLSMVIVRPDLFTIQSVEVLDNLLDGDENILGTIDSVDAAALLRRSDSQTCRGS